MRGMDRIFSGEEQKLWEVCAKRTFPCLDAPMNEIEVKILGIDRKKIETVLIKSGARKTFDGELHAVYFDTADNFIGREKGAFRLRRGGDKNTLTFKSYVEHPSAKVREELEVEVSDFNMMRTILESAGFRSWLQMKKRRTTYEYEGVHFEFDKYVDEYEFIPEFLEIEGDSVEKVYKYAEMLGFTREECRPWDAVQVVKYYSQRE